LVGVAHADGANTASPLIIGLLPPVHIGPAPWPPQIPFNPIYPRPPLPAPQPIIPGKGCVASLGTACPR